MKTSVLPDIFNDVIGPVMRGPSSSHTAASWRIARLALGLLGQPLNRATIVFEKNGAWAGNFREQGTTIGIEGGLLGLDMTDKRMRETETVAADAGIAFDYKVASFPAHHPNTVVLSLEGTRGTALEVKAISLGGGSIEIEEIDGYAVKLRGDYFESLLFFSAAAQFQDEELIAGLAHPVSVHKSRLSDGVLVNIKSSEPFPGEWTEAITKAGKADRVVFLEPVMPVISGKASPWPFSSMESLLQHARENSLDLGDAGILFEQYRSGLPKARLIQKMKDIIERVDQSIDTGLRGTAYRSRILQQQSHLVARAELAGDIPANTMMNNTIACVSAIMEAKSSMHVIVACPTAGSCGTVGGVLRAAAGIMKVPHHEIVKAWFAAGLIGVYFAAECGFSAEEHGCQVETGAAAGMAAAALVQLYGGSAEQAVDAAAMAIQNMIGLICDPVADRVEVPCLGKNITAAMNAIASATMARSGFKVVIPFDEVLAVVPEVGRQMPSCLKCTGRGGLAATRSARMLKERLGNET